MNGYKLTDLWYEYIKEAFWSFNAFRALRYAIDNDFPVLLQSYIYMGINKLSKKFFISRLSWFDARNDLLHSQRKPDNIIYKINTYE